MVLVSFKTEVYHCSLCASVYYPALCTCRHLSVDFAISKDNLLCFLFSSFAPLHLKKTHEKLEIITASGHRSCCLCFVSKVAAESETRFHIFSPSAQELIRKWLRLEMREQVSVV